MAREFVESINADVNALLRLPGMVERGALGTQPCATSPAEFKAILAADIEQWSAVLRASRVDGACPKSRQHSAGPHGRSQRRAVRRLPPGMSTAPRDKPAGVQAGASQASTGWAFWIARRQVLPSCGAGSSSRRRSRRLSRATSAVTVRVRPV